MGKSDDGGDFDKTPENGWRRSGKEWYGARCDFGRARVWVGISEFELDHFRPPARIVGREGGEMEDNNRIDYYSTTRRRRNDY